MPGPTSSGIKLTLMFGLPTWSIFVLTHAGAALMGGAAGAIGTYYGTRSVEIWKEKRDQQKRRERFYELAAMMPCLFASMSEDVCDPEFTMVRLIFPLRQKQRVKLSKPHFSYSEEEFAGLFQMIDLLEQDGFIEDVATGSSPRYQITNEFYGLLKAYKPKQ